MAKNNMIYTRLSIAEARLLEEIKEAEKLVSNSAAIRYAIRFTARAYNLLPIFDCPACESQQVEQSADDLLKCEKCGQEFGK